MTTFQLTVAFAAIVVLVEAVPSHPLLLLKRSPRKEDLESFKAKVS
jgi:hypothetical protein